MKTSIFLLLLLLCSSQLYPQSPVVQNIINQVNLDSLIYFVKELSGEVQTNIGGSPYTIVSRNKYNASNDKAADYIKQKLSSYGLATYDQWFSATGRNVYGVQTGTEFPNKKYMICAHYDDMPSGTAPGADDNASGTAAVIEAARIFTQYNSKYTIIYALWDEEEQGLIGSAYYALQANNANDSIMGVINMDMIAWDNDGDGVGEIHIRNYANSYSLKDTMLKVNTDYSIGVIPSVRNPGTTASDQASFWNNGYGALLLIEEYSGGDFNAYYHTVNDKLLYFNQTYFHKMSKLALGTVAELADFEVSTFALTVLVDNGWNMVSIPGLLPVNQNVTNWWQGKDPASQVYKYELGYYSIATAVPTEGYWMKNIGAQIYNTGDEWPAGGIQIVPHDSIPVNDWTLFGIYECPVAVNTITTNPPGIIQGQIYKYSGGYQAVDTLYPGYGYWVKTILGGVIYVPPCDIPGRNIFSSAAPQDFGKIIITDNTQKSYTLYSIPGMMNENELTQFDLPPLPPAGMFDIRFSSQRYAERLSSTPQSIDMTGVEYPINIKAEGIGIILSNENGKEIARLNTGEEVSITSAVTRLMVSEQITPEVFALEQNYPNPFNPETNIRYSIPEASKVSIIVYDILGSEVSKLINEEKPAGTYELKWNAGNLPSGVYFYRLQAGDFVRTKKMILTK